MNTLPLKNAIEASVNGGRDTIDHHVKNSGLAKFSDNQRTFEYNLSDKAAKSKLVKAAKRIALMVEENKTSSKLVFSAGTWHSVCPSLN